MNNALTHTGFVIQRGLQSTFNSLVNWSGEDFQRDIQVQPALDLVCIIAVRWTRVSVIFVVQAHEFGPESPYVLVDRFHKVRHENRSRELM